MFEALFGKKTPTPLPTERSGSAEAPQRAPLAAASSLGDGPIRDGAGAAGADFQNVLDEAAIIWAAGEDESAIDSLINFLSQGEAASHQRPWHMLLDIYQAQGLQEKYEKLAGIFAERFQASPPSWTEVDPALGVVGGRNLLVIEGGSASQLSGRSRDFLAASREKKQCVIDISRMGMDATTLEGVAALYDLMSVLRKRKIAATLMGEGHAIAWLRKKIAAGKAAGNPPDTPHWMLLLEIMQWRGHKAEFEELSLQYTIAAEISGPGWEPSGIMKGGGADPSSTTHGERLGAIIPEEVITDAGIQILREAMRLAISETGSARIDFSHVKRMEFSSAGSFSNLLADLGGSAREIALICPSELIIALGDVVGFNSCRCVKIIPRRR